MPTSFIPIAQYTLLAAGVLVAIGGIIGFVKAKSKPSLISGVASGILLGVCYYVTQSDINTGLIAGFVLLTVLDIVFSIRFGKTKKFMPSGMMIAICGISQLIVLLAVLQSLGMLGG